MLILSKSSTFPGLLNLLLYLDNDTVTKQPKIVINKANKNCEAPIEIPIHIAKSIKAKLKGSLTAVLNLMTDKAPTKPKERAS